MIERVEYGIRWSHPDADGLVTHETTDEEAAHAMLMDHSWRKFGTVVHHKITITDWEE